MLLAGLAPDGGLYLPEAGRNSRAAEIAAFKGKRYQDVAFNILSRFAGDSFTDAELREEIEAAYADFDAPEIAPLVEMGGNRYLLELFHGPTFAFKDIALQILGRLFAPRAGQARRPRHRGCGHIGRHRFGGDRRAWAACPISTFSCCIPTAASAKCSAAR